MEPNVTIECAKPGDEADLARLAGQLGYPVKAEAITPFLNALPHKTEETILVARSPEGAVLAWVSIAVVRHFYTPTVAEISGFVVEEGVRGQGIGTALMAGTLRWAREAGCPRLRLRANTVRAEAHRFYERLGFTATKQQTVFVISTGI